ncbi:pirin family protein [Micromonospora sp. WMMD1082]|uniref:pirin family protein n=1 Tax=Micromonospora sp. WMMD1082 TaxID=3016104 RepID=UPI002416C9B5|nr:pirin family protein [Micromonospora sp. WMMD1082]MDG4798853.1 pirin family protein [Micromonospora sp. WMMD1082]
MASHSTPVTRGVDRIIDKVRIGRTAHSDDSALIIAPGNNAWTDPFLVMGEELVNEPGFDWHPHRGLETVTLILDGALEHGDSLGNAGVLGPGDIQWMTAGRGIIHREVAARSERAHIIQMWINLPADRKLAPTRYQDLRAGMQAVHTEPGVLIQVVSGETASARGPAINHWPILGMLITLDPRTEYRQVLDGDQRAFAYVISGRLAVAGRTVDAGQIAWSDPVSRQGGPTTLALATGDGDEQTRVMLYAGRPIGESVVASGPFVMNTRAEIAQAYRDFHSGRFGSIPRNTRLPAGA